MLIDLFVAKIGLSLFMNVFRPTWKVLVSATLLCKLIYSMSSNGLRSYCVFIVTINYPYRNIGPNGSIRYLYFIRRSRALTFAISFDFIHSSRHFWYIVGIFDNAVYFENYSGFNDLLNQFATLSQYVWSMLFKITNRIWTRQQNGAKNPINFCLCKNLYANSWHVNVIETHHEIVHCP